MNNGFESEVNKWLSAFDIANLEIKWKVESEIRAEMTESTEFTSECDSKINVRNGELDLKLLGDSILVTDLRSSQHELFDGWQDKLFLRTSSLEGFSSTSKSTIIFLLHGLRSSRLLSGSSASWKFHVRVKFNDFENLLNDTHIA